MSDELGRRLDNLRGNRGRLVVRSRNGKAEISYADLYRRSSQVITALSENGVSAGVRVAALMNTSVDVVTAIIAVLRLGATLVPVYPYPRPNQRQANLAALGAVLRSSRAAVILVPGSQVADYQSAVAIFGLSVVVVPLEPCIEHQVKDHIDLGHTTAPALIQYSSGSTGNPKGIVIARDQLVAGVHGPAERFGQGTSDIMAGWVPLYHDYGLVGTLFQALLHGSSVWLLPPHDFIRDPLSWIDLLAESNASITGAPNFAYQLVAEKLICATTSHQQWNLASLRLATNGGEPTRAETMDAFEDRLRPWGLCANSVQPVYGLAENCAAATMPTPLSFRAELRLSRSTLALGSTVVMSETPDAARFMSLGSSLVGTHIEIVGDGGEVLRPGMVGRVNVSGQATTSSFVDAAGVWSPTGGQNGVDSGDLGLIQDDNLYVVGRAKDMFKHGGRAFDPTDIEISLERALEGRIYSVGVFSTNPALAETDQVNVIVEIRDRGARLAFEEAASRVREHVRREFGVPVTEVIAVRRGQIPKTTSGKLRRALLRQLHESNQFETMFDLLGKA